ncbi:MAG: hypothetical protein HY287_00485 [Planctomycetes bacterium]|nr:hypothetical protein [Planctomycetota bacterium]MBI3832790.1 hypothetical protein [Planctomycetota bacterium]
MSNSRKLRTKVQQGGRIEVCAPDFPVGQDVDVTIQLQPIDIERRSVLDILAECPGGVLFKSAEDVDSYFRAERDSWDR